jgi:hypothetical protein
MIGGIGGGILRTYIGIVHIPTMEDSDGEDKDARQAHRHSDSAPPLCYVLLYPYLHWQRI